MTQVNPKITFEWYPTPKPYTLWLVRELIKRDLMRDVKTMFEPCAGAGDIADVFRGYPFLSPVSVETSDLDTGWGCDYYGDATRPSAYPKTFDACITNPPFTLSLAVLKQMLRHSSQWAAMYHRVTLMEPLKKNQAHNVFWKNNPPNLTLHCPRFPHQRNSKGKWGQDSAHCVWNVWIAGETGHENVWPERDLFAEIKAYMPEYRARVDELMSMRLA